VNQTVTMCLFIKAIQVILGTLSILVTIKFMVPFYLDVGTKSKTSELPSSKCLFFLISSSTILSAAIWLFQMNEAF
jgi:hypothetical protein